MIKTALLGFGNVGRSFARTIHSLVPEDDNPVQICAVADVTGGLLLENPDDSLWLLDQQEQGRTVADCAARGDFREIPDYIDALPGAGISVLVECLPTNPTDGQPALDMIRAALDLGLCVVTVDKGPIVHGYRALTDAAHAAGTRIAYSGTTGVKPPVEVAGCHVLDIRGILNGTTNFVLSQMQEHQLSFSQALARAQQQGIAEPDPNLDIQGWDTACKILILANEWMNARASLTDVVRIGIGPETERMIRDARASGGRVRLIGRARLSEGMVRLTVAPRIVGA